MHAKRQGRVKVLKAAKMMRPTGVVFFAVALLRVSAFSTRFWTLKHMTNKQGGRKWSHRPNLLSFSKKYFDKDNMERHEMDQHDELPFLATGFPPPVNYALNCYKLHGKEALREACDNSSDLFLKRGSNATIIEHKNSDGRRFEYRFYGDDHENLEFFETQERREFPFRWKNVGKAVANSFALFALGILASKVFSIPQLGFGDRFSLNIRAAVVVAFRWLRTFLTKSDSTSAMPMLIVVCVLTGVFLGWLFAETDDSVAHDDAVTTPTLQLVLAMMGNRFQPMKAMFGSVAIGLASGIGEELFFRGVLQTVLARRLPTPPAVAIQAILFGLGHRTSGLYIVLTSLKGFIYGKIYAATQNLAIPVFLHAVWNTFMVYMAHVQVSDMTEEETTELLQGRSHHGLRICSY